MSAQYAYLAQRCPSNLDDGSQAAAVLVATLLWLPVCILLRRVKHIYPCTLSCCTLSILLSKTVRSLFH